jgi:hypothetical protein
MSSLPLISHRLFVAAVGTESTPAEEPARNEPAIVAAQVPETPAIPLEVLESSRPMPSGVLRRFQASIPATR